MRLSLRSLALVLGTVLGLLGVMSVVHPTHAQFDPLGADLDGVAGGDAAWADVDDDGDSDLLLIGNETGSTDNAQPSATLYENQGDGTFSPFNAGLEGVSAGSAAFGDFDDDGDSDLIITGNLGGFSEENLPENSAQIYENEGSGDFDKLNAGIEGVTVGCVDWADVDGDGTLDLVVAGNIGGFGILPPPIGEEPDPSVLIYEGDGNGSFEQVDAGIDEGVAAVCSSNFGDIDDDGDADLAITGGQGNLDNPEPYAAVYENDGTGTFSPVDAPITDVAGRAATWVDVDDNASLDLILAGVEADSVQRTRLYLNDGDGGFTESSTSLADVAGGAIAPADVDLDGDPDLALSGRDSTGSPVAFVYENDGTGEFDPFDAGLTPVEGSAAAWGDVGVETTPDLALAGRDADSTAMATIYENQIGGIAQAQFIHNAADPAAETVDVYFGNERALNDVGFRSATEFFDVPADLNIEAGIAPGGSGGPEDVFATQTVTFDADEAHTVVANGVLDPDDFADNPDGEPIGVEFFVESEADSTAPSGEVGLRGVHGVTDAPTVDIEELGATLFDGLSYGDVTTNYSTTAAEEKLLAVTASGPDTLIAAFQADLSGLNGSAATVLASGFLDPSANQNGEPFRLIAAQPNGTVTTFPLNQVPQFTSVPADFSVVPETEIDTTIEASDSDGDDLTFSAVGDLPEGASLDSSTGQFTWTPSFSQRDSTYAIGVQVSDGAAETDTSFAVTVETGQIALAQLIHNAADPEAETVDIYVNDERTVDDFAFRSATPFVEVPAATEVEVGVAPANSGGVEDTLASQTVTLSPDSAYTVVANGVLTPNDFADNPDDQNIGFEFFVEEGADSTASDGEVGLRAVHGATDAPTVDIDENGTTLLDDLTYGDVTAGYLSATAEEKRLVVTPGDAETVVASFDADLSGLGGTAATVLASGFLDPSANQDGEPFRLIAARPNGTVLTFGPAEVIPIQQARQQGPDSTVTVEGTVTRAFGSYVRFQDESGPTGASGLVIRQTSDDSLAQAFRDDISNGNITQGTLLQASGTLAASGGLLQVDGEDLDDYTVLGQEALPPPQAVSLSDIQGPDGEEYESELLRVGNLSFPNPDTTGGTLNEGFTYEVENQSGTAFEYRVQDSSETAVIGAPIPPGTFAYEGVLGQFTSSGNDEGYRFIPVRVASGLPVELADFEAVRSGASVELRWQTASETDNSGFRVQRETDRGWQSLGFVESKATGGTTTEAQSYRYTVDRELGPGTHRFRLKQVDLDGSTSLSRVVTTEVPLQGALGLTAPRPNPASGQAALSFGVKESVEATVTVYNVLGQRVKTLYRGTPQAGQTEEVEFDAGALPSGVYFVRLQADGKTQTRRLTVVR